MRNTLFKQTLSVIFSLILILFCSAVYAENIDPNDDDSQYAYGENVGWLNAEPLSDEGLGVEVTDTALTGYIWGENIGWVSLSCENTSSCSAVSYSVTNDGIGNLSGYAWGENVGWINFNPTGGGVTIDVQGNFDGWAWGENIGWIHFQNPSPPSYIVKTEWTPQSDVYQADVLAFFDESVTDGTLVGDGPSLSADRRLNALRNMIVTAGDLINAEDIAGACDQLLDALERTDGLGLPASPADFVTGEAADELAEKIQNLMTLLGCE